MGDAACTNPLLSVWTPRTQSDAIAVRVQSEGERATEPSCQCCASPTVSHGALPCLEGERSLYVETPPREVECVLYKRNTYFRTEETWPMIFSLHSYLTEGGTTSKSAATKMKIFT